MMLIDRFDRVNVVQWRCLRKETVSGIRSRQIWAAALSNVSSAVRHKLTLRNVPRAHLVARIGRSATRGVCDVCVLRRTETCSTGMWVAISKVSSAWDRRRSAACAIRMYGAVGSLSAGPAVRGVVELVRSRSASVRDDPWSRGSLGDRAAGPRSGVTCGISTRTSACAPVRLNQHGGRLGWYLGRARPSCGVLPGGAEKHVRDVTAIIERISLNLGNGIRVALVEPSKKPE